MKNVWKIEVSAAYEGPYHTRYASSWEKAKEIEAELQSDDDYSRDHIEVKKLNIED